MRHTKIIATVGPATDSDAMIDALIAAGTDIVRLNFSHGTHETHGATYARVRAAASRAGRDVAILQDLGGPKIRTGRLEGGRPIELHPGEALRIATGDFVGSAGRISTTFDGLARGVHPGDRLLLADGNIELRVEASDGVEIQTTVIEGGSLGEHKGINAPGVALAAAALTVKDAEDLMFGVALGVDMVALSFVRSAADVADARRLMSGLGAADLPLVAKLERPEAIAHLEEILDGCQAVMVARGDLGLEMPMERVPGIQKEVIRSARRRGIPVIVATQVLESMTHDARPTRAEVSDAANAVAEGVDAIMLAAETAIGAFPARAVRTLDTIICEAERAMEPDALTVDLQTAGDHVRALCAAAVTLATRGDARAIVAVTEGGSTARQLSALRPRAPILAATQREDLARRLALHWGVAAVRVQPAEGDDQGAAIARQLVSLGHVAAGAAAVFINVNPDLTRHDANYLRIERL
jgi:pyruvate kinase